MIDESFDQLIDTKDKAMFCECHNEELRKILIELDEFYRSINFDSNSDISDNDDDQTCTSFARTSQRLDPRSPRDLYQRYF